MKFYLLMSFLTTKAAIKGYEVTIGDENISKTTYMDNNRQLLLRNSGRTSDIYDDDVITVEINNQHFENLNLVFDNFPNNEILIIRNCGKLTSSKNFLEKSNTLKILKASGNEIETIEEFVFNQTKLLTEIKLTNNSIQNFFKNSFAGLQDLRILDLSHNQVSEIDAGSFNCPQLNHLNLSYNCLTEIDDNTFQGASQLQSLDLSYNGIGKISKNSFAGLLELKTLYLSGNEIESISHETFRHPMLTHLFMEANKLKKLPNFAFKGAPNLQKLVLRDNDIEEISESAFWGLTKLKTLGLKSNKISVITNELFKDLRSMTELNLSHNHIRVVEDWFTNCISLDKIILRNNRIEAISKSTFDAVISNLKSLDVRDNPCYKKSGIIKDDFIVNLGNCIKEIEELKVIKETPDESKDLDESESSNEGETWKAKCGERKFPVVGDRSIFDTDDTNETTETPKLTTKTVETSDLVKYTAISLTSIMIVVIITILVFRKKHAETNRKASESERRYMSVHMRRQTNSQEYSEVYTELVAQNSNASGGGEPDGNKGGSVN